MTDIKTLNDNLRKSFIGGRVILTQGINVKTPRDIARILAKVGILIISLKPTISIINTILEVLIIMAKRYIGKLIIMTRVISFIPQIQAIQK